MKEKQASVKTAMATARRQQEGIVLFRGTLTLATAAAVTAAAAVVFLVTTNGLPRLPKATVA